MEPDAGSDLVSEQTEDAEASEAETEAAPDRAPTAEETEAAERAGEADPSSAEAYQEMSRKGAEAKGEGRIP